MVEQVATTIPVVSSQGNSIVACRPVHRHYYILEGKIVEEALVVALVEGPFHHNSWVHMKGHTMLDTVLDKQSTMVVQTSVRHNSHCCKMGSIDRSTNRSMYLLAQV